jgi:TRAP-type C4-dicarboxylate transport system permease large subunit
MMEKSKSSWLKTPTKKQVLLVFITWFVSIFLITIAMTDFFGKSFLQKGYFTIYLMMIVATAIVIRVARNYWKTRQ